MKKIFHLSLLCCLLFSFETSLAQKINCEKIQNGTFKFKDKTSGKIHIIKREDTIQTEEIEGNSDIYSFYIVWIDKCIYLITPTEETKKKNTDFKYVVQVEILEIKDKSYIIRTTIPEIKDFSQENEVFLVE
jgi:hypothetical protein